MMMMMVEVWVFGVMANGFVFNGFVGETFLLRRFENFLAPTIFKNAPTTEIFVTRLTIGM